MKSEIQAKMKKYPEAEESKRITENLPESVKEAIEIMRRVFRARTRTKVKPPESCYRKIF